MSLKAIMVGAAMLATALPAAAQQRGTVELGAFASAAKFDESLSLKNAFGGGARVGVFLDPLWSIEFEMGEMRATRPNGLKDVNVGILSTRLIAVPIKTGALSIVVGVGAGVGTETSFLHSYGVNALLGARFALTEHSALRIDAQNDWLANYDYKSYQRVSLGLSLYRDFFVRTRADTVRIAGPAAVCNCVQRPDSVDAAEQARRRRAEQDYRALRDSLNRNPPMAPAPVSSAEARLAMEERIQFEFDKSALTPAAKTILDGKVAVFRANPTMTILISGNTGNIGTDSYNWALGTRRAESAKAYMVAQGIAADRIKIETKGESNPVVSPPAVGIKQNAPNRRDMFVLIVVPDVIKKP